MGDDWFREILARHPRIALTGGSGTGKTYLSGAVQDRPVIHADAFIDLGWSQASEAVRDAVNLVGGPLLVEGAAVPRALRKGMRVDAVVMLTQPKREQSKGQRSQEKGLYTAFCDWQRENPGVPVYYEDG